MTQINHLSTIPIKFFYFKNLPVKVFIVLSFVLATYALPGYSQEKAKTRATAPEATKKHSIGRAAAYSAILPGLGQAYNKKYWKIPIIYAGFGVIGYFIVTNNNEYQLYREAYVYTANNETYPTGNPYVGRYNLTQLQEGMDFYRRNRDLSYIIGGVWYVANILEAYVDAHFFDYDISEDLTLRVGPSFTSGGYLYEQPSPGIKISLKF